MHNVYKHNINYYEKMTEYLKKYRLIEHDPEQKEKAKELWDSHMALMSYNYNKY